ncbi:MAG: amidohydrolase family protein [Pseudomonadales bacterium]|nr:amidohydrolase family protein [Pseudomonadales bacterium]
MSLPEDLVIIDPHIHQWDLTNTPRMLSVPKKLLGWNKRLYEGVLNAAAKKADRDYVGKVDYVGYDYLPQHYAQDAIDLNISHIVHVEAKWMAKKPIQVADETAWVDKIFREENNETGIKLGGIVGYAEFRNPNLDQVIKAHIRASERLVGLRQMLAWDDDKGIMRYCDKPGISRDPEWRKHFSLLESHNLSFDAWFFHHQLDEMVALANTFPGVNFMLCHMGTPIGLGGPYASYGHTKQDREEILAIWQKGMAKVAQCPNVSVKLSGFFMPVVGWGYHQRSQPPSTQEVLDSFKPLVDFTIEQFGVDRCMFASNFPMDKVSMSLPQLYEVYGKIVEDYSRQDLQKLFHDNAASFYKIKQKKRAKKPS